MKTTIQLPPSKCPNCNKEHDAATSFSPGRSMPIAGDVSICINCAYLMEYDTDLKLIPITDAKKEQLVNNPEFKKDYEMCLEYCKRKNQFIN